MKKLIFLSFFWLLSCGNSHNAAISTSDRFTNPINEDKKDISGPFVTNFSVLKKSAPERNPSNTEVLFFVIHFNEPVANLTIDQFEIFSNDVSAEISYLDEIGDESKSFVISVQEISGNGEIGLKIIDDYSIEDLAGNQLRSYAKSQTWVIDHKIPTLLTIAASTSGNNPVFKLFFSEPVFDLDPREFELVTEEGNIKGKIAKISPSTAASGLFSYDVSLKSISGSGKLRLDFNHTASKIRDYAGNKVEQNYLKGAFLEF